jgi:NitT/TauT family transport system substrate-binding protein
MGDKALIIGTIQKGDRYGTVVRINSNYKTWHDLKGKTVGTRMGTGAEQVLRRYLEKNKDLRWEDFKWVNIKLEDMIAALQGGRIEAFTAWEPTCAIAEAQGFGRILRTYGDVSSVPVSLHTTVEFSKKHRPEIVKFLASHLDKAEMIQKNPERAATLAAKAASAKGYDVSADVFSRVFRRIDFSIDIDEKVLMGIQDTAQFLYDQKNISKIPGIKYDKSFLDEAMILRKSK